MYWMNWVNKEHSQLQIYVYVFDFSSSASMELKKNVASIKI